MFAARQKKPKGWKNPMRQKLYRVVVEAKGEKDPIAISPAVLLDVAEELKAAIAAMIIKGHETRWTNPTVVLAHV